MEWSSIFTYLDGKLFWKTSRGGRVIPGSLAGHATKRGYVKIRCGCSFYLRHRIVWEMHNGPIPEGMQIDHINHVPGDDRIENLRLVTSALNNRNVTKSKLNKSGVTGVCYHKRNKRWIAYINTQVGQVRLGSFINFQDAVNARKNAEIVYEYHENHGTERKSF